MSDLPLQPAPRKTRFMAWRTIMALILRQMSSTYGRTPGGYLWAVLEPAAMIVLMTAIFSAGFRSPSLGTNFAIYYASGYLPFHMWQKTEKAINGTLRQTRGLLTFPRVTLADAIAARMVLEIMTQLLVSYIILAVTLALYDTRTILILPDLIFAYVMAISLALGVGLLNCFLINRFPLWKTVWSVISRPLVLVSGVIFLHERVPEPYRTWLEWNPLVHVVSQSRSAFYISYQPDYIDPVFVFLCALITGVVGALFLVPYYRNVIERG